MADDDDWENFSAPTFSSPPVSVGGGSAFIAPSNNSFDEEEEDLTLLEQAKGIKISTPSAAQLVAAKKKAQEEEELLANQLQYALQANETPEEKKLRERRMQEEAEVKLMAKEMGVAVAGSDSPSAQSGVSIVSGVAGFSLKNKQDHTNFAITVANKMSSSTAICTTAFALELVGRIKGNISPEGLDALIQTLTAARASRTTVQVVSTKKSKKDIQKEIKRQDDIFGGVDGDKLALEDKYADMEDDSFF